MGTFIFRQPNQTFLDRFSYFKNWDTETKRECSIIARTKTYKADEVILGDGMGLPTYSYLITKGSCSIIEHLQVLVHYVHGIKRYRLVTCDLNNQTYNLFRGTKFAKAKRSLVVPPAPLGIKTLSAKKRHSAVELTRSSTSTTSRGSYMEESLTETHFIKVCELTEGAIFNVGEMFERRRVVADANTHCLLIPRYWLMKMNKDNIWSRVQQFLNKNIPTTRKIFDGWTKEKKFIGFRKKLIRDILETKTISNTNCIHNVPYSIRLKENPDAIFSY